MFVFFLQAKVNTMWAKYNTYYATCNIMWISQLRGELHKTQSGLSSLPEFDWSEEQLDANYNQGNVMQFTDVQDKLRHIL